MKELCDIHCHILPEVDDGAKNMDIALAMIEAQMKAGVETIILTPHFRKEMFEPSMEEIWDVYDADRRLTGRTMVMRWFMKQDTWGCVCIWAVSFTQIWRWWRRLIAGFVRQWRIHGMCLRSLHITVRERL